MPVANGVCVCMWIAIFDVYRVCVGTLFATCWERFNMVEELLTILTRDSSTHLLRLVTTCTLHYIVHTASEPTT